MRIGAFTRLDFVGDNYINSHPLKVRTRKNRGLGTVVSLSLNGPPPANFGDFLTSGRNKACLYQIMSEYFLTKTSYIADPICVFTNGKETLSNAISMLPSSHI